MPKEIYLIKDHPGGDYQRFKNTMLELSNAVRAEANPDSMKISLTIRKPPGLSVIPFRKERVALISITRKTNEKIEVLMNTAGYRGGYLVDEAVPVSYEKTWADGSPTPGACLLTLFHRRPDIDRDAFIRRWHEGHTPLSLRLHPLWNYNRNVVNKALTEDSCWYDGIVEEQFKTARDLLNPFKFFGPSLKVPIHMYQVYMDTKSFIDMKRIETYLAEEYHIKSTD